MVVMGMAIKKERRRRGRVSSREEVEVRPLELVKWLLELLGKRVARAYERMSAVSN
jgi:hypothetical protein